MVFERVEDAGEGLKIVLLEHVERDPWWPSSWIIRSMFRAETQSLFHSQLLRPPYSGGSISTLKAIVFRSLMNSSVWRPPIRPRPLAVPLMPPNGMCSSQ
jgi:hypothetical protein